MTISKWTPDFSLSHEVSIVPVWVVLPRSPLHFYNARYVLKLVRLLGRPLKVDSAMMGCKRPSLAHMVVEIDVAKQLVQHI